MILAEHAGSMDALMQADAETLAEIDEIGPIIAQSVYDYLHSTWGGQTIDELKAVGVCMESSRRSMSPGEGKLKGKTFVVTGTLDHYTREEMQAMITQHGGRVSTSVSKRTDYVIAGEKAGSKRDKAIELGVTVIGEAEFEALLK